MAGTHGELFSEIGRIVVAAHAGQAIDLTGKSYELASRYAALGLPADAIARAIARSLGAIGVSMEIVPHPRPDTAAAAASLPTPNQAAAALFPSGVRLAVVS